VILAAAGPLRRGATVFPSASTGSAVPGVDAASRLSSNPGQLLQALLDIATGGDEEPTSPEVYGVLVLVLELGWSPARYASWLADVLIQHLLPT
jgi:hypothetical protein